MSIILGIDPGLNFTGWGVINNSDVVQYVSSGIIKTTSRSSFFERIAFIHKQLNDVINLYSPKIVVLEKIFINKNFKSSLNFAYARGSIMLTLALYNLKIEEIEPTLMKKMITGNGHASKDQVIYMVENVLKIKLDEKKSDVYDALALAISAQKNL